MADKPPLAEDTRASALPDKPPRPSLTLPAAVSAAEGSGMGLPAGSIAVPEVQPLAGVAASGSTSTSTKHPSGLPGLGQSQVQAHVPAAAAVPQVHSLETISQREDCGASGTGG